VKWVADGVVSICRFPGEFNSLGRSFAACFGCIALVAVILIGLANGDHSESILSRAIYAIAAYAFVGWCVGSVANGIVMNSVEMNYRTRFEQLRQKAKDGQ
jgi:hypothetical protein